MSLVSSNRFWNNRSRPAQLFLDAAGLLHLKIRRLEGADRFHWEDFYTVTGDERGVE